MKNTHIDSEVFEAIWVIVEKLIKKKKLIIYGGLAIDYALRLKGDKIYDDNALPDFDVYSDTNINIAYDLYDKLDKLGYVNITVIRSMVPTTIKVRLDFHSILDLSYHESKNLPTLVYKGFQIIHPDYQRIDIHKALGYPYKGYPDHNFVYRFEKDTFRLGKLDEHYPIVTKEKKITTITVKIKIQNILYGIPAAALYFFKYGNNELGYKKDTVQVLKTEEKSIMNNLYCYPRNKVNDKNVVDLGYNLITYETINGYDVVNKDIICIYLLQEYFRTNKVYYMNIYKHLNVLKVKYPLIYIGKNNLSFAYINTINESILRSNGDIDSMPEEFKKYVLPTFINYYGRNRPEIVEKEFYKDIKKLL